MKENESIMVSMQNSAGNWCPVGVILGPSDDVGGGFVYDPNYFGPALCPQLDYTTPNDHDAPGDERTFLLPAGIMDGPKSRTDLHAVFETALPGKLAQKLIATHMPSFLRMSPFEQLVALSSLGDWRQGGLMYQRTNEGIDFKAIQGLEALSVLGEQFNKLIVAAKERGAIPHGVVFSKRENFGAYATCSDESFLAEVLVGNNRSVVSSPTFCIAKLGDAVSGFPEAGQIEAGLLQASTAAGIRTAEFLTHAISADETILLTQRTDTTALPPRDEYGDLDDEDNVPSLRRHKLPMNIALDVVQRAKLDYTDVADFLASRSPDPADSVRDLYGRMMFNAFGEVSNDHLGQFEVLQEGGQWALAPTHSLMIDDPDTLRPHGLKMAGSTRPEFSVEWVDRCSKAFDIPRDEGREIASRVLREVAHLPEYWRGYGVSEDTIARFSKHTQTPLHGALRDQLEGRIGNDVNWTPPSRPSQTMRMG